MTLREAMTEAEARFDRRRRAVGRVLAPALFVALWLAPLPGLSPSAHALAAVAAATVALWITEAVPLPVAALLGPALAVLTGVAPAKQAFAPLSDPLIYLFLGGFVLAEGLARQGVDRRIALWLIARPQVAGSPSRAMVAIGLIAWAFSMWISNTATCAMLLPVALGLHATMREVIGDDPQQRRALDHFGGGMCLLLAYAASIGGVATPIGTGPNVIAIGMLEEQLGEHFGFTRWMAFALPLSAAMMATATLLAVRRFRPPMTRLPGLADEVARQLRALGPVSAAERRAVAVFGVAVLGWLTPSLLQLALGGAHPWASWAGDVLDEGVVAIVCASALFVLPSGRSDPGRPHLLSWEDAQRLDWGTLLLLGGGLSLGKLTFETGLAEAIGRGVLANVGGLASHPFGLLTCAVVLMLVLTEVTSNTAVTSMMLPVFLGVAQAAGLSPLPVAVLATIAASFAFMLPVSTPPNAMAYGTRMIRIESMMALGTRLDLAGLGWLLLLGATLLPLIM